MIRKIAYTYLLLAAVALAADKPADPYGQLATYDFSKSGDAIATITCAVETATAANRAAIEGKLLEAAARPEATYACKSFVAEMLRVVGSKACLPVVMKWMDDPKTAHLATYALHGMKDESVDEALIETTRRAKGPARQGALHALAARHNNQLVPVLVKATGNKNTGTAQGALTALGTIGTPEAAAALKAIKPAAGRQAAAREGALNLCAWRLMGDGHQDLAREIWLELRQSTRAAVAASALNGLVEIQGAAALPAVLEMLKDKRVTVAVRAAHAARAIEGREATRALVRAMRGLKAPVQVALLRTLAERKDPAAYPAVQRAMASANATVRCEAVRACATLGNATTVQPLLELAAGDDEIAKAARESLARLNQPGIDDALMKQLDDPKREVVGMAAGMLAARGYRAALPRLMQLAASQDTAVRSAAIEGASAFVGTGDVPQVMGLLAKADKGDRDKFTRLLWVATRGVNPKDERFMQLWKDTPKEKGARIAMLGLASQAGGTEPLKVILEQTKSTDKEIQEAAMRAMFGWPDDTAAAATLEVLKTTDNKTLRVLAARALANRLADKKAKLPLEKRKAMLREAMAKLDRDEDKQTIKWALERMAKDAKAEKK